MRYRNDTEAQNRFKINYIIISVINVAVPAFRIPQFGSPHLTSRIPHRIVVILTPIAFVCTDKSAFKSHGGFFLVNFAALCHHQCSMNIPHCVLRWQTHIGFFFWLIDTSYNEQGSRKWQLIAFIRVISYIQLSQSTIFFL